MSDALFEEGWIAPRRTGPDLRILAAVVVLTLIGFGLWFLAGHRATTNASGSTKQCTRHVFDIADDGTVTTEVRGARVSKPELTRRGDRYSWLTSASAPTYPDRAGCVDASLRVDAGVENTQVTLRAHGDSDLVRTNQREDINPSAHIRLRGAPSRIGYLFSIAAPSTRPGTKATDSSGTLDRFDARRADDRATFDATRETLDRLPYLAVFTVAMLLVIGLSWRRRRKQFFSMRRPGPGTKELPVGPPSSIDPVGAAVLVSGAEQVDATAAFAGHVLDLVERKLVRMRRSVSRTGVTLGLFPVEEEDGDAAPPRPEDPAITVLRSIATYDDHVELPDSGKPTERIAANVWKTWEVHVAGRERFERVAENAQVTRKSIALFVVVNLIAGFVVTSTALDAGILGWIILLGLVLVPQLVVFGAYVLDVRRWRRVRRERRVERAQWLHWRGVVAGSKAPTTDRRMIPALAAIDVDQGIPAAAARDAVGLNAVVGGTVRSIRALAPAASPSPEA